jgi:hypothetical protein
MARRGQASWAGSIGEAEREDVILGDGNGRQQDDGCGGTDHRVS